LINKFINVKKISLLLLTMGTLVLGGCDGEDTLATSDGDEEISAQGKLRAAKPQTLQAAYAFYCAHHSLQPDSFIQKICGFPVSCLGIDPYERELYFVCSKQYARKDVIAAMLIDTTKITWAPCDTGDCTFGSLEGNVDSIFAFRTAENNIKIPADAMITGYWKTKPYNMRFATLAAQRDSTLYYSVPPKVLYDFEGNGTRHAANLAKYISKPGNEFLKQLADSVCKGKNSPESKAQALLNFVTQEIAYSYEDQWYQAEVTKNAAEVLVTGIADCSGKTTLYASLLEQVGIPHCILYFKGHASVGVAGSFGTGNQYKHTIEGKQFYIAETTAANYEIGKTLLQNDEVLNKLIAYHFPAQSKSPRDAVTHEPLEAFEQEPEE
jgi:transglutaminase-like putative cysteine protease